MTSSVRRNLDPFLPWPLRYLIQSIIRAINKMTDCIFCKIADNTLKATIVYQDDLATAFRDINPAAPTHILIIPNRHIESVNVLEAEDEQLMGHLFRVARQLAAQEGIAESGYRMITNTGAHGGQTVPHLHIHLIGGQPMKYPRG
jgi:histidine triad (HIT) family protein